MSTNRACSCRVSSRTSYAPLASKFRMELTYRQEKLNEAVMALNKNLQVQNSFPRAGSFRLTQVPIVKEINIQNMNVELVAQMFRNYRSNVLFHLEGEVLKEHGVRKQGLTAVRQSYGQPAGAFITKLGSCVNL